MVYARKASLLRFAALCWASVLTGCVSQPVLQTPTGRPEVTFEDARVEEIKNILINAMLNWGYQVKNVSDSVAVYEKPVEGAFAQALLGSRYDSQPLWRLTYNLATVDSGVRVVTNIHAVTNPNSAFERITDMSKGSKDAAQIQQFLETARAELAVTQTVHGRGKVGIAIDTNLKVTQVQTGSPAEVSGVRVGDRILAIDGVRVLNNREATLKITGEPGTAVELQIDRGGSQQLVRIIRGEP